MHADGADPVTIDQDLLLQRAKVDGGGVGIGEKIGNELSWLAPIPTGDLGTYASGAAQQLFTPVSSQHDMARRELAESSNMLDRFDRAKTEGDSSKKYKQAYSSIEKAMGKKGKGMGVDFMRIASKKLDDRTFGPFVKR